MTFLKTEDRLNIAASASSLYRETSDESQDKFMISYKYHDDPEKKSQTGEMVKEARENLKLLS